MLSWLLMAESDCNAYFDFNLMVRNWSRSERGSEHTRNTLSTR